MKEVQKFLKNLIFGDSNIGDYSRYHPINLFPDHDFDKNFWENFSAKYPNEQKYLFGQYRVVSGIDYEFNFVIDDVKYRLQYNYNNDLYLLEELKENNFMIGGEIFHCPPYCTKLLFVYKDVVWKVNWWNLTDEFKKNIIHSIHEEYQKKTILNFN